MLRPAAIDSKFYRKYQNKKQENLPKIWEQQGVIDYVFTEKLEKQGNLNEK